MDSLWEDVSSCSSRDGGNVSDDCESEPSTISSISGVYSDLSDFDFDILEDGIAVNQDKPPEYISVAFEEVGSSPEPDWTICDSSPPPEPTTPERVLDIEVQDVIARPDSDGCSISHPSISDVKLIYDVGCPQLTNEIKMETPATLSIETSTGDFDYRMNCSTLNANGRDALPLAEGQASDNTDHGASDTEPPRNETSSAKEMPESYVHDSVPHASVENDLEQREEATHSPKQRKLSRYSETNGERPVLAEGGFALGPQISETSRHDSQEKSYTCLQDMDYRVRDFAASGNTAMTSRAGGKKRVKSCLREFGASVAGEHFDVMRLHSWTTRQELEDAVQDHMDFVVRLRRQQANDGPYSSEAALQQLRNLGVVVPAGDRQAS